MRQYLPHAALAVLLGAMCVSAQAKTFKCLSSSSVDCTTGTTDVTTTTFTSQSKPDKNAGPSGTGGSIFYPSSPSIAPAVPEPESYAMMALGMGIIAWALRRRRSN
jgi:hypothetical protein